MMKRLNTQLILKGLKMINKTILTMSKQEVNKERYILEAQGMLENRAVFQLNKVIDTIHREEPIKVLNNVYIIGGK